jgi:predicted short-subunit dehydrogenase-like oxidoreductase (DUF2520 family)
MEILLVGSGNTATILGRKCIAVGHRIVQVYSRQPEHAQQLARQLSASHTSLVSSLEKNADMMIVALRDEAILPFMNAVGEVRFPVAHTAGSVSIEAVENPGKLYGVLYPLQSLRKEIELIPPITMLVDGNTTDARELFLLFAESIAETVFTADDSMRLKYHLAATVVNNFSNYLFSLAENFCRQENINFTVLQPLIEETVIRLRNISPASVQTGPAVRNDQLTLDKHRKLIKDYPSLSRFYEIFTQEIQNAALKPNP